MHIRISDIITMKQQNIQELEVDIKKALHKGHEKHVHACKQEIRQLKSELTTLTQQNAKNINKGRRSSDAVSCRE